MCPHDLHEPALLSFKPRQACYHCVGTWQQPHTVLLLALPSSMCVNGDALAQLYCKGAAGAAAAAENGTGSELSFSYTAAPFALAAWRSEAERRAGGRPLVAMEDRFIFKVAIGISPF